MPWEFDPGHSIVEFSAKHMGIAILKGRFFKSEVIVHIDDDDITQSTLEATIDPASVNVFHERATELFKSEAHLDVARYPEITFKSRRIEPRGDNYAIIGDLSLHGVTREVAWDATYNGEANDHFGRTKRGFSAYTTVNLPDYGISGSSRAGEGGDEHVRVELQVELIKREEGEAVARRGGPGPRH
ncbi:MAG: YceI family protein [Chloroflexi bacterium]|nr:YceI family protein [Chloroflexota bacterium]